MVANYYELECSLGGGIIPADLLRPCHHFYFQTALGLVVVMFISSKEDNPKNEDNPREEDNQFCAKNALSEIVLRMCKFGRNF